MTIDVLALADDFAMQRVAASAFDARGFSDNPLVLLAMLVYTTVFSGLGGWVSARLARRNDRHLLWFYGAGPVLATAAILAAGRWRPAAFDQKADGAGGGRGIRTPE